MTPDGTWTILVHVDAIEFVTDTVLSTEFRSLTVVLAKWKQGLVHIEFKKIGRNGFHCQRNIELRTGEAIRIKNMF